MYVSTARHSQQQIPTTANLRGTQPKNMSAAPTSRRSAGSTAVRTRPARTGTATASSKTNQKQRINLAGSTAVISDYFHYAINCILYQRAIYDQADFKMVKKFGLQMMVVEDEMIADYLKKIVDQVRVWLVEGKISRLVLVIQRKDNGETIERWEFDVHVEHPAVDAHGTDTAPPSAQAQPSSSSATDQRQPRAKSKTLAEVQSEIQVIIRQIIATVSFLPIPEAPRTFKVLAHTHSVGQDEATQWNDSDAFDITEGAERVKLKSFSTALHRVDTAVDYKLGESVI
ncbi:hypothetical protein PTTG_07790 [Puccinia triticina 1-1 BBBD Race 1]|uniref:HORMA domain-containing protein n=1 Tax=Puccinia triticina (isolate 1-1 / race 1 (BBBD)) TaxID=630390 RepID=A0A180G7N7_PUCT1|nr:hypothetical protein PTTG_07790 [Puccinia triticina 1-1 BBBD Race 1]WAR55714.1 hypothetical protein PtB15_6B457 [Puccinia triticina]